jgi:hypothetical protein
MEAKNKQQERAQMPSRDEARAAYMVAWRDRCIARLEEELAGREEERRLLCALLYGALVGAADRSAQDAPEVRIGKAELSALLGRYTAAVENTADAYIVRFTPQKEDSRNGASEKG